MKENLDYHLSPNGLWRKYPMDSAAESKELGHAVLALCAVSYSTTYVNSQFTHLHMLSNLKGHCLCSF